MEINIWTWIALNAFLLGMIALDFGVFKHERARGHGRAMDHRRAKYSSVHTQQTRALGRHE